MSDLDKLMNDMPEDWRSRWCGSEVCACMGCANVSGGIALKGYSKADWQLWLEENDVKPYVFDIKGFLEREAERKEKYRTVKISSGEEGILDLQTKLKVRKIFKDE